MDSPEYFRLQSTALKQVEALTKQTESGELAQTEAEQKIIAIMKTLEQQTSCYLPERRAALARQQRLFKIIPWALVALILLVLAYRSLV